MNLEEILQSRGSGVATVRGTGTGSRKWEALMTPWAEIPGAGEPERGDSGHLKCEQEQFWVKIRLVVALGLSAEQKWVWRCGQSIDSGRSRGEAGRGHTKGCGYSPVGRMLA